MQPPTSTTDYAQQLARGFRWLRFAPPLEAEYRAQRDASLRARVLSIGVLGLVVWCGYWVLDQLRIAPLAVGAALQASVALLGATRLGVSLAIVAALIIALLRPRPRALQAALLLLALAMAWGSAYSVYAYKLLGVADEASILVLMMLALFLPIGLRLAAQVGSAVFYVACVYGLALAAPDLPVGESMMRVGTVLLISMLVLAVGSYWREHQQREQFLYRKDAQWLAMRDGLTGLYNRRSFTHHLERVLRLAQREQQPLALLLLDLDHFKAYNDSHGHPAGDEALRRIGQALEHFAARPLDMAARLGGEEFALLLHDSSPRHAQASAQALVHAVQALAIAHGASPVAEVLTVSVGMALRRDGETPQAFYSRADRLLYEAKHSGRNRCCGEAPAQGDEAAPARPPAAASAAAGLA